MAQSQLTNLMDVVSRLKSYYDVEDIKIWLHTPHPQLNGQKAIDLIHAGRVKDVFRVLDRLDSDAYL